MALTKAIYNKGFSGNSSILPRIKFCVGRQDSRPQSLTVYSLDRCMKPLTNITHKYDVKEEMENKKTFCKALCGTKTVRGIY